MFIQRTGSSLIKMLSCWKQEPILQKIPQEYKFVLTLENQLRKFILVIY